VQPYQHHTCVPEGAWPGVYSFALSPEEHQPSGALNFSRIDSAILSLKMKPSPSDVADSLLGSTDKMYDLYVYAVNYNVLRILSGMGGLAFSN